MKILKIILNLFMLLLFLSCWKKQDHEVTAPEIPNYILSGTIKDIDTGTIIVGSQVNLLAVSLVYSDAKFNGASDTSDSEGKYTFKGITPGNYQLSTKRGKYEVSVEQVVVEHNDKTFDIALPKVLLSHIKYNPLKYFKFYGIYWIGSSIMAGVGPWQEYSDDLIRWQIVTGNFESGFEIVGRNMWKDNPSMKGITFLYNYWTCGISATGPKLYAIYPGKGYVEGEISVPYPMNDLTNDGMSIWATVSVGKIVKYGVHPSIVEKEYDFPSENPSGIAWDGEAIWTSDASENLIYHHDAEMNVSRTFRPIYEDYLYEYNVISGISYLCFDFQGDLWACDGNYVFVLQIDE